jgi:hypothetical protein
LLFEGIAATTGTKQSTKRDHTKCTHAPKSVTDRHPSLYQTKYFRACAGYERPGRSLVFRRSAHNPLEGEPITENVKIPISVQSGFTAESLHHIIRQVM